MYVIVFIKDVKGVPIFAAARCFEMLCGVEAAEASAVLVGLHWAASLNLNPVLIESDALNVVMLFLLELYPSFSVLFVPRLGNNIAHCITKWVVGSVSSCCWASNFPDWLLKCIRNDGGLVCSS
ncbi:hypothetical protein JRO89_XS05G0228700 [Xanthoceras sorbifolium]|uniref:RNase H type-1 domain-containing protein n=1 Tax=Xanthoceras sorbifolium TaxID=99658 RepID=A0ABQ8I2U5_9ROSI|nr:hypothetical protein JRO89_XS05G0228700 [Xanthoceras sorbifolium]